MINTVHRITDTREAVQALRASNGSVALVPTMGNLHEGHLHLVQTAKQNYDSVVVSIFVNPLQFGPDEDFDSYPRTLEDDCRALESAGADLVFAPSVKDMYPGGQTDHVEVKLPHLAGLLCGAHRPGHFDGVGTVVMKLFNIVAPDAAYFGEKDYQQLQILRIITEQLNVPVEIHGVPTVRADDGLALSSRNQYLTQNERQTAPLLHTTLQAIATAITTGRSDYARLQSDAEAQLGAAGFQPDYVEIRDADTLALPGPKTRALRIIAAAKLGGARLIDNIGATLP